MQLHSYPGGICWLRARESDIGVQIVQFATTHLGLHLPEDLELPERISWCWQHWRQGNTLVVLDDVNNYSHIQKYLPPQPSQFKVLITTRLKLDLASSLFLEVLSETDALLLLAQLIREEKQNQELAQAKEFCQRLGYLPLALQLVGRYIKKRKISLAEMLRRLEEKGLAHPSLIVNENDPTWTLNVKRGVAAAFELSWSELSDDAQQLGCLLSLFALAPIPWSLVERAASEQDQEELEDARVELENLHLLQGEETYRLHQLIREFLSDKQNNLVATDEQKYNFCQAMVEVAKTIPDSPTQEFIRSVKYAIPHLAEVAQSLTDAVSDENLIKPFVGLGRFYEGQGMYALAEPLYEQCVSVVQTRLGEEHPSVASSFNNLAYIYQSQGRYEEAEFLHKQALEMQKKLLGNEHLDVAESLNCLGLIYTDEGRYAEAELVYVQALEIRQHLLGTEHQDIADSLNNLALLHDAQGRYIEAESLLIQALKMRRHLLGNEHPRVGTSLNNLAYCYNSQGCYTKAEPLYLEALELSKRLLGEEHTETAVSYNNLAYLYVSQERYSEAEPLFAQALEINQKVLGEKHPNVATSLNNLASLYDMQSRHLEAEPLYIKALEMRKRLLGENHPDIAISLNNLAKLYYLQHQFAKAKPLYVQALAILKMQLGDEHPITIKVSSNLEQLHSEFKSESSENVY